MTEAISGTDGRPPLGTQDLHVHTTMSDGDLPLTEVVAVAAELGIQVGIADHVSRRNRALFVSDQHRLDDYLEAIGTAPVFRSAELCWCDEFSSGLSAEVVERFDYLIGSNHGFALPDGTPFSPWTVSLPDTWRGRHDEVMEITVANLCRMIEAMPIQIAAHVTLLPPALLTIDSDVHAWWTEERETRVIDSAVRNGVAIEISNRYRLPHQRFLRRALEAGASFSLGSDGHQREQVARLDWAVAAAREVGIGEAHLFIPERRF